MQIKALHVSALTYILKYDFIEFVCCLKKMKSASVNKQHWGPAFIHY